MNLKQATLLLFSGLLLFSSCKKDPEPIVLTQSILDSSTSLVVSVTGPQNGMDFAHGPMVGSDSTVRDIYSTTSVVSSVSPGTIVTKRTFLDNADGSKGDLMVTFAMIKHLEGWWPEGNDWEYVMMPNDGTIDYAVTPNGDLSKAGAVGQLAGCQGCHALANDGDQLFIND